MKLHIMPLATSLLLACGLVGCQPAGELTPTEATTSRQTAASYLFEGNPGISTDLRDDLTGTAVGTLLGEAIEAGPDKTLLTSRLGFAVRGAKQGAPLVADPSLLTLKTFSKTYGVDVSLRAPIRVGTYRIAKDGRDLDAPGSAMGIVYPDLDYVGILKAGLVPIKNQQIRVTAVSPEWIDVEFVFMADKPGAVEERIAFRTKNKLSENTNLLTQSASAPFWSYRDALRTVEVDLYRKPVAPLAYGPRNPAGVQVRVRQLTPAPVSRLTYAGQTIGFESQVSALSRGVRANDPAVLNLSMMTLASANGGQKQLTLTFDKFTGTGTYANGEVAIAFSNATSSQEAWTISTRAKTTADTRTRVDITQVTPDVIEGTYVVENAPVASSFGGTPPPPAVSLSGTFKLIYPR